MYYICSKHKKAPKSESLRVKEIGASGENRTPTLLPTADFEFVEGAYSLLDRLGSARPICPIYLHLHYCSWPSELPQTAHS